MTQAPMTQNQTKSKARMIRNILQTTTHLQTDTKRNESTTQSSFLPPNVKLYEQLFAESDKIDETHKVDQAFAEMFSEFISEAVLP